MRVFLAALALLAFPACVELGETGGAEYPDSYSASTPYTPSPSPAPRRSKVMVLKDVAITQPTEVLGLVDVFDNLYDHDKALESLKLKAEQLGADAVVGLEYHHGDLEHPSRLSGTAIRFKDLFHGRNYEPIGTVEVTYEPGGEEDGMRALKAKARAMKADLIVELKYERDAKQKPRVSGTAVRFVPGDVQP